MHNRFTIFDCRFFVLLSCFFYLPFSAAFGGDLDVAVIAVESDVDEIRYARNVAEFERMEPIRFYQAESVRFEVSALHHETPVDLSGDGVFVRWEAYEELGDTNAWIHKVGTVTSGTGGVSQVELAPEESGLDAGDYHSFLRAFQVVEGETNRLGVLAYHRLEVLWSPDANVYTYEGPFPVLDVSNLDMSGFATTGELAEVRGQVSAVSGRVDVVESDVSDLSDRSDALENATNSLSTDLEELTTKYTNHTNEFQALETGVVYRVDFDGSWYFPDWFDWGFEQVPVGVPDSSSTITNDDLVLHREVYSSAAGSFDITFSGFKSDEFVEPSVTSSAPSIATATVDRVHYVSSGTCTATATVGDFSRSETLVMEILSGVTSDVPVSAVSGSAVEAFAAAVDSRLTDGTDMAVYSVYDHAMPSYIRDAACWAADLDLTCISPWNSTGGRTRAGVLIGSDAILFANHYPIGIGATIRFVTSSNTIISRTLLGRQRVGYTDFMAGRLSSAISTNDIRPAVLLPSGQSNYMPFSGSYAELRPMMWVDQWENAHCNQNTTLGYNSTLRSSTNAVRSLYNKTPVVGDSGSAMFLVTSATDPLVVIGTMLSAMGGPSVSRWNAEIRAAAASLGCDTNSIVDADFEALGYTNFNPDPPTP